MTKVIILGEPTEEKQGKKIEFVHGIATDRSLFNNYANASQYKNVVLIMRNFGDYDLMIAYNDNTDKGCLYLGHFNDGIV